MPGSKYERELRFIETETARIMRLIAEMAETLPASPQEALEKARSIEELQRTVSDLAARRKEIVDSFIKAGLDVPDTGRSMNATVHNAGAYEIRGTAEAEAKAGLSTVAVPSAPRTSEDVNGDIADVTSEINALETRLVRAEIDGDDDERQKVSMMISSLRSRRDALIQEARAIREEESAPAPATADAATVMRIDALEADSRALRAQVADVRSGLQDVRDQLVRIMRALGIDEDGA